MQTIKSQEKTYSILQQQYKSTGITYKSNEALYKLSQSRQFPYLLLLHCVKTYHFNQFETIFLSHILFEQQPSYLVQPQIFDHELTHPILDTVFKQQQKLAEPIEFKQLRNIYIYLLVVGYSVKFYLNDNVKPYEQEIKKIHPQFFNSIFNIWAQKYGNKALRTNPRKINTFYSAMFQLDENQDNVQTDICQFRNYNEIVEELLKTTTEIQFLEEDIEKN